MKIGILADSHDNVPRVRAAVGHFRREEVGHVLHAGDLDVVVSGNTHDVEERRLGATLLLNPGEAGGWLTGRCTVALVDLATITVDVRDLDDEPHG